MSGSLNPKLVADAEAIRDLADKIEHGLEVKVVVVSTVVIDGKDSISVFGTGYERLEMIGALQLAQSKLC